MRLRSTTAWTATILVVALGLRVAVVLATSSYKPVLDGGDYFRLAVALIHGHGYANSTFVPGPTALRPPLYPGFLAAVFGVFGDSVLAARLVQAVIGTVTVALIGVIGWQLWGRRVGLISAGIAAVLPSLFFTSTSLMTESLYIPLVAGAIASALQSRRSDHPLRWAVLTGVLCGLGLLTRPNGIALVIGAAVLVPITFRGRGWRGWLAPVAVVGVGVLMVVPWTIRNAYAFQTFVPISDSTGFNIGGVFNSTSEHEPEPYTGAFLLPDQVPEFRSLLHDHLNEYQLSQKIQGKGVRYALDHPGYVVKDLVIKTWRLFGFSGAWNTFSSTSIGYGKSAGDLWILGWAILALVTIASFATRAARKVPLVLWVGPLLFWLTSIPISGEARFRTPIEVFAVVVSAVGIAAAWDRLFRPASQELVVSGVGGGR